MIKKLTLTSIVLAVSLFLSGCDQLRSPQGVVGLAFESARHDNLAVLTTVLTDEALTRYGNEQGLRDLQKTLLTLKLKISKVWLTQSLLGKKDVKGTYIVRIKDTVRNVEAAKLNVYCFYGKPPRGFQDIEPSWDRCWIKQILVE